MNKIKKYNFIETKTSSNHQLTIKVSLKAGKIIVVNLQELMLDMHHTKCNQVATFATAFGTLLLTKICKLSWSWPDDKIKKYSDISDTAAHWQS